MKDKIKLQDSKAVSNRSRQKSGVTSYKVGTPWKDIITVVPDVNKEEDKLRQLVCDECNGSTEDGSTCPLNEGLIDECWILGITRRIDELARKDERAKSEKEKLSNKKSLPKTDASMHIPLHSISQIMGIPGKRNYDVPENVKNEVDGFILEEGFMGGESIESISRVVTKVAYEIGKLENNDRISELKQQNKELKKCGDCKKVFYNGLCPDCVEKIVKHWENEKEKSLIEKIETILNNKEQEAEEKAKNSLDKGKFIMFGYWKAIGVHFRKVSREFRKELEKELEKLKSENNNFWKKEQIKYKNVCFDCRYLPRTDGNQTCTIHREFRCPDDPSCDRFIQRKKIEKLKGENYAK